jgi:predicted extracellular nuclease
MKKLFLFVILITFFLNNFSCDQDSQPLLIGYWNIENLFDLIDDPDKNDDEFSIGGRKKVTQEIYELKLSHSAEVLTDLNADVVGLSEVENELVLKELVQIIPNRNYNYIHYDSPDERGIDNTLIYDPNRFKVLSSEPIPNTLPGGDKTRDILYVIGEYSGEIVHLFVNHWPSNYGGREKSIPKRAATAQLIVREILSILSKNASAEILLLGDFNENPNEMNIQSLKTVGLTSLMEPMLGEPKKGTYVYRGEDYFYDQIIIHASLQDQEGLVIDPESIYILDLPKYRQQEGRYAHYPYRFWVGNSVLGGYSDHLAVRVSIIKK